MDESTLLTIISVATSFFIVYLLWNGRLNMNMTGEEMHERIDDLEEALKVVGSVLERLPELVPQFSINQNPFQSIIEAFAEKMKANMGGDSYAAAALRDDNGQYSDGTKKEENEA
jgi:hypothetical protein